MDQIIADLKKLVASLQAFVNELLVKKEQAPEAPISPAEPPKQPDPTPVPSKLELRKKMARAISEFEGGPGDLNYINNNPGNIKYGPLARQLGAIGVDPRGFAKWPSWNEGLIALERFILLAAEGKLKSYQPSMSLIDFFHTYQSDGVELSYARYVAKRMGVEVTFQINNLA